MVSPSSMFSVPWSWPSAIGKQVAAAINRAALRNGVMVEINRTVDTEPPAEAARGCIMTCFEFEFKPLLPLDAGSWWRVVARGFGSWRG